MKACPACGEQIQEVARKCRFCGEMVDGSASTHSPQRQSSNSNAVIWIVAGVAGGGLLLVILILVALLLPAVQSARGAARRSMSKNNMKQIGLALHNYHDVYRTLPPGAVVDANSQMYHGWQTALLPFVDQAPLYNRINFNAPWDDPRNALHFRNEVPSYLNPGNSETRDSTGLGLSHYSGNVNLFNENSSTRFPSITDGLANTLMAGEVAEGFQPWGKPGNWRDPSRRINTGPNSFGSPFVGGANFLLGDGSVRFISDNIDPQVLKALSTPDGNEAVGAY